MLGYQCVVFQWSVVLISAIKPSKAEIELGDVKSGQAIDISIPYTGSSASELANVSLAK